MGRVHDVDLTLSDGTKATVEYTIASADYDVGIHSDYAEEWWLTHLNEKPVAVNTTCYRREIDAFMTEMEIEPYDDHYDY
jgi:hypothetical protein